MLHLAHALVQQQVALPAVDDREVRLELRAAVLAEVVQHVVLRQLDADHLPFGMLAERRHRALREPCVPDGRRAPSGCGKARVKSRKLTAVNRSCVGNSYDSADQATPLFRETLP